MYQNHLFRITSIPFTSYFIVLLGCGTESRSLDKNFFEDGEGTLENPYQIANLDHLQAIGDTVHLDKHFIQIADIDASASTELQNGSAFSPLALVSSHLPAHTTEMVIRFPHFLSIIKKPVMMPLGFLDT